MCVCIVTIVNQPEREGAEATNYPAANSKLSWELVSNQSVGLDFHTIALSLRLSLDTPQGTGITSTSEKEL